MAATVAAATGFGTGSTVNGTTATVTKPTGSVPGDLLICWVSGASAAFTWSAPNFTAVTAVTGTNGSAQVLYRVLDGSANDPGATFTVTGTAGQWAGTCLRVTGANTLNPFDPTPTSGQVNASSANITAPGITTTINGDLLIWGGGDRVASGTPNVMTLPSGYTDSGAGQTNTSTASNANAGNIVGFAVAGPAGATGNVVGTETAATANSGVLLGVQAAPAIPPPLFNPGPTWRRLFVHRQILPPPQAAAPAAVPVAVGFTAVAIRARPAVRKFTSFAPGIVIPVQPAPAHITPPFTSVAVKQRPARRQAQAFIAFAQRPPLSVPLIRAVRAVLKAKVRTAFLPAIRLQPPAGTLTRAIRAPPLRRSLPRAFAPVITPPAAPAQVFVLNPVKAVRALPAVRKRTLFTGPLTVGFTAAPDTRPTAKIRAVRPQPIPRPRPRAAIASVPVVAAPVAPILASFTKAPALRRQVRRSQAFAVATFPGVRVPAFTRAVPRQSAQVRKAAAFRQAPFVLVAGYGFTRAQRPVLRQVRRPAFQPAPFVRVNVPAITIATRPVRRNILPRRTFVQVSFIPPPPPVIVPGFVRVAKLPVRRVTMPRTAFFAKVTIGHLPGAVTITAMLAQTVTILSAAPAVAISAILAGSQAEARSSASVTISSSLAGSVTIGSSV